MILKTFLDIVTPYTMTSIERITELYYSLEYIRNNNIKGDFVESGVWKGGNVLGVMEYFKYYDMTDRKVWLYDTFQGMTMPEDVDVDLGNQKASDNIKSWVELTYLPINEVKQNLSRSNYPIENVKFIIGDVCETLNVDNNLPTQISILRLDTDWYKSTKKELEVLYPLLSNKGVLIVDDYGHWKGSKKAVDDYFKNDNIEIIKIDYSAIKMIKKI